MSVSGIDTDRRHVPELSVSQALLNLPAHLLLIAAVLWSSFYLHPVKDRMLLPMSSVCLSVCLLLVSVSLSLCRSVRSMLKKLGTCFDEWWSFAHCRFGLQKEVRWSSYIFYTALPHFNVVAIRWCYSRDGNTVLRTIFIMNLDLQLWQFIRLWFVGDIWHKYDFWLIDWLIDWLMEFSCTVK